MPDDDRDWVLDAAASVPGVRGGYHLVDPETGNGLSVSFFDDEQAMAAAYQEVQRRGEELGWHNESRPQPVSSTVYKVTRHR